MIGYIAKVFINKTRPSVQEFVNFLIDFVQNSGFLRLEHAYYPCDYLIGHPDVGVP